MAVTKSRKRRPAPSPEQRAEWDAIRDARVEDLKSQFDQAVSQLVTTDAWGAMLEAAVRFRRYSFRNMLLILSQCPHATQVEGFREWIKRGRAVRKGERALWILAPMTRRVIGAETAADNGQAAPAAEGSEERRVFFAPVKVFDISQTYRLDGEPDAEPINRAPQLEGEAPALMWPSLAAYVEAQGYALEHGDTAPAEGWTSPTTRTVRISDTLSDALGAQVLAHEAAHIACGHLDTSAAEYRQHRGRMETEAESVAYIVCRAFGLEAAAVSVPYVAGWAGKTADEVQQTIKDAGQQVITAAQAILTALAPDAEPEQ
ncbi:ArdC-like ssDNA-binding domain-containing protein [Streptomyces sp. NPDC026673]|uniref:ArdC-like ssDNA-binding domain-containing protein n=1 Tax=Streptomyces sp. NPDC026673 TaxID=3155724 RepID=UPI0034094513